MATLVKFYHEKESAKYLTFVQIFAYFPQLNYNKHLYGNTNKTSYAHIGQYSACHIDYIKGAIPATKDEYLPLLNELKGQGYTDLKVLNKEK